MTDQRIERVDPLARPARSATSEGGGGADLATQVSRLAYRVTQLERRLAGTAQSSPSPTGQGAGAGASASARCFLVNSAGGTASAFCGASISIVLVPNEGDATFVEPAQQQNGCSPLGRSQVLGAAGGASRRIADPVSLRNLTDKNLLVTLNLIVMNADNTQVFVAGETGQTVAPHGSLLYDTSVWSLYSTKGTDLSMNPDGSVDSASGTIPYSVTLAAF